MTSRVPSPERLIAPFTAQFVRRLADGAPHDSDRVRWLAQRIAMDPERVALYMSGRRTLSIDKANAMAIKAGMELGDLLQEFENAPTPRSRQSRRRA